MHNVSWSIITDIFSLKYRDLVITASSPIHLPRPNNPVIIWEFSIIGYWLSNRAHLAEAAFHTISTPDLHSACSNFNQDGG